MNFQIIILLSLLYFTTANIINNTIFIRDNLFIKNDNPYVLKLSTGLVTLSYKFNSSLSDKFFSVVILDTYNYKNFVSGTNYSCYDFLSHKLPTKFAHLALTTFRHDATPDLQTKNDLYFILMTKEPSYFKVSAYIEHGYINEDLFFSWRSPEVIFGIFVSIFVGILVAIPPNNN